MNDSVDKTTDGPSEPLEFQPIFGTNCSPVAFESLCKIKDSVARRHQPIPPILMQDFGWDSPRPGNYGGQSPDWSPNWLHNASIPVRSIIEACA